MKPFNMAIPFCHHRPNVASVQSYTKINVQKKERTSKPHLLENVLYLIAKRFYSMGKGHVLHNLSQLRSHNIDKLDFIDSTWGRNCLRRGFHGSFSCLATTDPWGPLRFLVWNNRSPNVTRITVSLT